MEEAVPGGEGAMAAILGADPHMLKQVTEEVTSEGYAVQIANMNSTEANCDFWNKARSRDCFSKSEKNMVQREQFRLK